MSDEAEIQEGQSEQLLYANVLQIGMYVGLMVLFITFGLYVSGILSPAIPIDEVPNYWHQGVHDYLEAVNHDHLRMDHPPTGLLCVYASDRVPMRRRLLPCLLSWIS
jgi:hypothetical protein